MKVIFENATWRVYEDGDIEHAKSRYCLSTKTMLEKDFNGDWYHNPLHMAEKGWVDMGDYLEAWIRGLVQSGREVNWLWVATSVKKAINEVI